MITSVNVMYMPAHNFHTNFFIITKRVVSHSKLLLFYDDGTATILCLYCPAIQKESASSQPLDRGIFFYIILKCVLLQEILILSDDCIEYNHGLTRTPSPERIAMSSCF